MNYTCKNIRNILTRQFLNVILPTYFGNIAGMIDLTSGGKRGEERI